MARNLSGASGIGSDPNFINGDLVDSQTVIDEFINQDIVQFFQKMMDIASLTANGNADNETNGYQFIEALRKTIQKKIYFPINIFNSTPIALTATKILEVDDALGSTIVITGDVTNHTLKTIDILPDPSKGVRAYIYISGSQDITIENTSSPAHNNIETPSDADVIAPAGSILEFIKHNDQGWSIISSTKPLIKTSGEIFTKVIEIGDWDMDATATVNIVHGLTLGNIRSVDVIIRNDSNNLYLPLIYSGTAGTSQGWFAFSGTTNISLSRLGGGHFDHTDFDSTSYNRGWVTIIYTN